MMPIEASQSNGLFSSNKNHLPPRGKGFPSYRFISSFTSHKQSGCSDSLLFKGKLLFDITFPLLNQWGLFSSAWDTALHSKQELLLEQKALFWLLRAPTGAGCWQLWDNPLHEGALLSLPREQIQVPCPFSCILSPLIWTVAVRDEDNPFTLWASQEKTVLWLIPGDQPKKGKETQLYNPASIFSRISIMCDIRLKLYRELEGWAGCQSKARGIQCNERAKHF